MDTTKKIQKKLQRFITSESVNEVFFAGNRFPAPFLAFAVHFPRLTVTLKGKYKTQIEQGKDIVDLDISPGKAVFVPPNCWDKPDMSEHSETLHFLFGVRQTGISLVTSKNGVKAEKIALQRVVSEPEQKILDIILDFNRRNIDYPAYGQLVTSLLACYIQRLKEYDKPARSHSKYVFQEICAYIQENFQNDISRSSVAGVFDITPNHLSRVFRNEGYMNFCDYVNYVRINRAKFLLQNYDLPLYQIAKRCGYNDVVYFCRIFKKITKKTAKQYRAGLLDSDFNITN